MANVCIDLSMKDPLAQKALATRLDKITEINDSMRERLREQIRRGTAKGETTKEIAARLEREFDFAETRARTIARTEANGAASDAREIQFGKIFGEDYDKEWISSRDAFVRDSHQEVDGEIVPATDLFSNGLDRPYDPAGPPEEVINCRCTWVAHPLEEK